MMFRGERFTGSKKEGRSVALYVIVLFVFSLTLMSVLAGKREVHAKLVVSDNFLIVNPGAKIGRYLDGILLKGEKIILKSSNKKVVKPSLTKINGFRGLQVKGLKTGKATVYVKRKTKSGKIKTDGKCLVKVCNYEMYLYGGEESYPKVTIEDNVVTFKGGFYHFSKKDKGKKVINGTWKFKLDKDAYIVESTGEASFGKPYKKLSNSLKKKWKAGKVRDAFSIFVYKKKVVAIYYTLD